MPGAVYIDGGGLTLHTVEEEDLPFLRDVSNDPAVRAGLIHRPPLNLEAERDYFESIVCADGEPAGSIALDSIDDVNGSAAIGRFIAEEFWGAGHGTEAARLLTDYAVRERRLHRVYARVRSGNEGSARVWEKPGYRHEATHREAVSHEGEFVDVERFAVLVDEWDG